jgi:hypothetical protein
MSSRSLFLVCLLTSACKVTPPPPSIDPQATVRFVASVEGEVAPQLVRRMAEAKGRQMLVYVSASWCEPCRRFHEAVDRGELTGKLGPVDLVTFDGEYDAERLMISGYEQQMIPAFTVPGPDGRATTRHLEGGVSGEGAVADLVPRLRALLETPTR